MRPQFLRSRKKADILCIPEFELAGTLSGYIPLACNENNKIGDEIQFNTEMERYRLMV